VGFTKNTAFFTIKLAMLVISILFYTIKDPLP
jgi:hypothetical protein